MWKHPVSCKSINMKVVVTPCNRLAKPCKTKLVASPKCWKPLVQSSYCHNATGVQSDATHYRTPKVNVELTIETSSISCLHFSFLGVFSFANRSLHGHHTHWHLVHLEHIPTWKVSIQLPVKPLASCKRRLRDEMIFKCSIQMLMLKEECAGTSLHHTFDFRPVFLFLRNVRPACRSAPHN